MSNDKLSNIVDVAVVIRLLIDPLWPVLIIPLAMKLIRQKAARHFMVEPCLYAEYNMAFTVFIDAVYTPILVELSNKKHVGATKLLDHALWICPECLTSRSNQEEFWQSSAQDTCLDVDAVMNEC